MERGRQAQRHVGGNSKLISIQTDCQRMTSEERLRPTARSHALPYPRPFAPPMPMPTLSDARATRIPSSHFLSLPAPSLGRGRRGGGRGGGGREEKWEGGRERRGGRGREGVEGVQDSPACRVPCRRLASALAKSESCRREDCSHIHETSARARASVVPVSPLTLKASSVRGRTLRVRPSLRMHLADLSASLFEVEMRTSNYMASAFA